MILMKCKHCHNDVERTDLYCRYCGSQLFKAQKREISVPKPRQNRDGEYTGQIMVKGDRFTIKAATLDEYEIKARAAKLSLLAMKKASPKITLGDAIDRYIEANDNVLSPSTIRGYRNIRKNRFKLWMNTSFDEVQFQNMVNFESELCSPKTLVNAYALVRSALKALNYSVPEVNMPAVIIPDLMFLDYEQIPVFLEAIRDKPGELAAILALHSLRMSELLAITYDDVVDNTILVNKALVRDEYNQYVYKKTKTVLSTRSIPVMIPRLTELLHPGRLVTTTPVGIERQIERACAAAGLPNVGCHGLRRSFASLAYHLKWDERSIMQVGGWSNMQTVHKVYIKLSKQDLLDNTSLMSDFYAITSEDRKPLGDMDL
jgi:integrase